MIKVYEAYGDKRDLIDVDNGARAWYRFFKCKDEIGVQDFIMIGSIDKEKISEKVDIKWCLNGLLPEKIETEDITIIEPLEEHYDETLKYINELSTSFSKEIKLSEKALLLISTEYYEKLIKNEKYSKLLNGFNVRVYEGEKDLAIKMIFWERGYIYLDINKEGFTFDKEKNMDIIQYNHFIADKEVEIMDKIDNGEIKQIKKVKTIKKPSISIEKRVYKNCKMISGLTKEVEGKIELDDMQAVTDIGKIRENQEDAILLMKAEKNPKFKMMVVADGVGGGESGEVASHITIDSLRQWFDNLSENDKKHFYSNIGELQEILTKEIKLNIHPKVQEKTDYYGGSTLVCAIVGEKETLITNIGDSRAYAVKNGKLTQISKEDTVAQKNLDKGKTPNKEAARFDESSNVITQCIGMSKLYFLNPNFKIIKNDDYDMLLLFTDGVTDCLSDEDIAVACRTTDKKELANKIVEKAMRHDSIRPIEYEDYEHLDLSYISGGKDNTTAAIYVPKNDEER